MHLADSTNSTLFWHKIKVISRNAFFQETGMGGRRFPEIFYCMNASSYHPLKRAPFLIINMNYHVIY